MPNLWYTAKFLLRVTLAVSCLTGGFILILNGWDKSVASMAGLAAISFGALVAAELIQESVRL